MPTPGRACGEPLPFDDQGGGGGKGGTLTYETDEPATIPPLERSELEGPLSEIDHRAVLAGLSDAVVVADDRNRILYVNPAAESLLAWEPGTLSGQPLVSIVPPRLHDDHLAGFSRFIAGGRPHLVGRTVRVPARRRDGTELPVELSLAAFTLSDQRRVIVGSLRDLRDRVALERHVAMAGYFRATSEVAALLSADTGEEGVAAVAQPVLRTLGESLGWQLGALWMVEDDDRLACCDVWHAEGIDVTEFATASRGTRFALGAGLPGRVWATGEPVWIPDVVHDRSFPRARFAAGQGLHAGFAFPVVAGDVTVGVVEFFTWQVHEPDPDLIAVVSSVGHHLGLYVERSHVQADLRAQQERAEERHRTAVELVRTLQASLLPPHLPEIPGIDVAACYRAAAPGVIVGGDFYDLFPLDGPQWGVVIGDVCGKGAPAAVLTALARYTVRAAALHSRRPSDVLADLNEALLRHADQGEVDDDIGDGGGAGATAMSACTAAYLRVEPQGDGARVELCAGGHPLPLLVRGDGTTAFVGVPGTMLGPFPEPRLTDVRFDMTAGDTLVLYTDGVTEARSGEAFFDEERLEQLVAAAPMRSAAETARAIEVAVTVFGEGRLRDDVAIVVLRIPA